MCSHVHQILKVPLFFESRHCILYIIYFSVPLRQHHGRTQVATSHAIKPLYTGGDIGPRNRRRTLSIGGNKKGTRKVRSSAPLSSSNIKPKIACPADRLRLHNSSAPIAIACSFMSFIHESQLMAAQRCSSHRVPANRRPACRCSVVHMCPKT